LAVIPFILDIVYFEMAIRGDARWACKSFAMGREREGSLFWLYGTEITANYVR